MLTPASANASATRANVPGRLSRKIASCFVICISQLPLPNYSLSFRSIPPLYSIHSIIANRKSEGRGGSGVLGRGGKWSAGVVEQENGNRCLFPSRHHSHTPPLHLLLRYRLRSLRTSGRAIR